MKGTLSSMENQFLKQVLKEETSKLVKKKFTQNSKFENRSNKLSCSIELANNNVHVMQEDMYEEEDEESISYPSDISEEEKDI